MRKWLLLGFAASLGLIGCSKETDTYYVEIKSSTSWVAEYGPVDSPHNITQIQGEGDMRVDILDAPPVCLEARKLTADGSLEVVAYKHVSKKGGIFHSDDEQDILQDSQSTTEPAGTVQACTQ